MSASSTCFLRSVSAMKRCRAPALLLLDLVAQILQPLAEARAPGVLAHHQPVGGPADRFGGHDLVGRALLDHAVLVDAGLVREGVGADDRLVRRDGDARCSG